MSGRYNDLSKKQEIILGQFKERLVDIWRDDFNSDPYLLRWLRARDFDLKRSEKMLRSHIQWRETEGVDDLLDKFTASEAILKYYPGGYLGYDKEDYPIRIDPLGHVDPKGLFQVATYNDLMKSRLQVMEHTFNVVFPKASRRAGRVIDSAVVILDLQKFGLRHLWKTGINGFIDLAKICEANYPEAMHRCYIINAPAIFPIAFNLIRPFLHSSTQNKIVLLGANYKTDLLKSIDADQLPACYGGSLVDSNGNEDCREWICWGGEIPTSYYLRLDNVDNMIETSVDRGASLLLNYNVDRPGYVLQWQFQTESHDIRFCVFHRVKKPSKKGSTGGISSNGDGSDKQAHKSKVVLHPLIPNDRISSQLTCIKGEVLLREPGTYVVQFDNSYSWTRSKKLTYRVDLLDMYVEGESYQETYKDEEVRAESHISKEDALCADGDRSDSSSINSFHSATDDTHAGDNM